MNGDNPQTPDPNQAQSPWQYRPTDVPAPQQQPVPAPTAYVAPPAPIAPAPQFAPTQHDVTWSASEYIAHEKGLSWYGLFVLAILAVVGAIYFITRDIFSTVVILALAGLVAYSAGRKPQIISYKLDDHGLTIGNKFRPYAEFRSFAVVQEGAFSAVTLAPLKRFAVPISLYYEPKDEDAIIGVISQYLPVEHREHDPIDKLTRRIRF
jgi:hypothetical protein